MDSDDEILDEFLNTESSEMCSSSSEDDMTMMNLLMLASSVVKDSRTTIKNYVEEVMPTYSEEEFISHFRIKRSLFESLCKKFKCSKYFPETNTPALLTAEKNMAIFLWFVGHQTTSYRDVANQFDVSLSTAHLVIERVSKFLCDLAPEVIQWPTVTEQEEIAQFFCNRKGFPNVAGIIDGSHIKIDKPTTQCPDSYINRKGYYSVHIQVICDHKKKIRDIFLGYPGSVHDARVFANSEVHNLCEQLADNGKYIIGDSAYPCLEYILTPYKDNGYLTEKQKIFNRRLSSCRVFVEHTIGILKQRFRQLYHFKTRNIPLLLQQIKACCVLHNIASDGLENVEETEELLQDDDTAFWEINDNDNKEAGKLLRELVCNSL